jgi:hypothetical protein
VIDSFSSSGKFHFFGVAISVQKRWSLLRLFGDTGGTL